MRLIHTADLHLDAPVRGSVRRAMVRREALATLERMIGHAVRRQIKYMVIAGDLFDTPCPDAGIAGAVKQMMASSPLTFVIAPGNHDAWQGTRYGGIEWPDNVVVFGRNTECFATDEGTFIGVGFYEGMRAHPLTPVSVNAAVKVAVVHGALEESEPLHRIDASVLSALGADYIALGHIHKGEDPHPACGGIVGNAGSPAPHGFDEAGERSFLEIEINEGGVRWQRIPAEGVRFYEEIIEVSEQDTYGDILGRLTASAARYGEKDIFRFRLRGSTLCSLPTLLEDYPSLTEIIDETTLPLSAQAVAKEQSLRGFFTAEMLRRIEQAPSEEKKKYEAALRLGWEAFE